MAEKSRHAILQKINNFGLTDGAYEFISNLAVLLRAGMSINESIASIAEDINNKRLRKRLGEIGAEIAQGLPLSEAVENSGLFSLHTIALIKLGEDSGRLPENLGVITEQYAKETLFRSRLRSSLMYSVIVFSLAIIVGGGTTWYTLPKIATLYTSVGIKLPAITQAIIDFGDFVARYGAIIAPIFVAMVLSAIYFFFSFPRTKFIGHFVLFHVPLIKKLIKEVEVSRFGYFLGSMLSSGMPILDSLQALSGISTFHNYQMLYKHMYRQVELGENLSAAINSYAHHTVLLTASVRQMIKAAEQSGNLPETLLNIGRQYEQKTEITSRDLPTIIEPVLLILIALGIALLALGTILPMYQLIGSISR